MKRKFYIYMGYIALAFGILFFLSGCKSAELITLESAASIIQLQTGREVSRSLEDKDVVLGKPVYAKIQIEYEPINPYTKEDVYEEIVAILEENHWERDKDNIVPDAVSGSLQQGDFKILTTVLIQPDKNLVTLYMEVHRNP
jgi:hypothetical protein